MTQTSISKDPINFQDYPISIVIPAYNEENRLPPTLEKILLWLKKTPVNIQQVTIVDDGSQDRTPQLVLEYQKKDPRFNLIQERHVGAMNAMITGFKSAKTPYVVNMEADCAVHPEAIEEFIGYLKNYDVVMGSRILRGNLGPIEGKYFLRQTLSIGFSLIFRMLFRVNVYDPQIGFKLYRKKFLDEVLPRMSLQHDGLKSAEIIVKTYGLGYSVKEIPVKYIHDNDSRCVPTRFPFLIVAGVLAGFFQLWMLEYRDFKNGLLKRNPIRGGFLLFWIRPTKNQPQKIIP